MAYVYIFVKEQTNFKLTEKFIVNRINNLMLKSKALIRLCILIFSSSNLKMS